MKSSRTIFCLVQLGFALAIAGCASRQPSVPQPVQPAFAQQSFVPPGHSVVGVASWYGPGFNCRHTATGEIYDQRDLTAATEVYRLGDRVMVSNLSNGRSVEVMINDRGPFAKGRIIDLSYGAARSIGMIGPGTTRVRLQLVSASTSSTMPRGYYVQAGSFGTRVNADRMRDELARRYSDVTVAETVIGKHHYYRVRMGAFETEQQARARAHQTSGLALPMIIVTE